MRVADRHIEPKQVRYEATRVAHVANLGSVVKDRIFVGRRAVEK